MTLKLITRGIVVDPNRHLLEFGDEAVHVRPRTFALLLVLLRHPRQVLSKQYLLETIWDDVVVDEQVLFQTIRELRQLIRDPDLIKTYPRKGYAWSAAVEAVENILAEQAAYTSPPAKRFSPRTRKLAFYALGPLVVMVFLLGYLLTESPALTIDGPILVLPVKNSIPDSDHNWVPLGAMDQLISALKSDRAALAMDTEYVLETMQRAGLSRNFASEEVARVFVVSGAAMVVETTLSGSIEEYRLDYRLHFKNDLKRGTLFGSTVAAVIQELGQTITRRPLPGVLAGPIEFNSELMSRALERKDAGDLEAAASLFTSLKELETNNLAARRLLAQVLIDQGKAGLAESELTTALALAGDTADEKPRLSYWQAVAQMQQHQPERALQTLSWAELAATQRRNHLYLAYIAQLRGELQQKLGNLQQAKAAFDDAIRLHSIIRCPLGEALTRRQLAALFQLLGASGLAEHERKQVRSLAQTHQLLGFETL